MLKNHDAVSALDVLAGEDCRIKGVNNLVSEAAYNWLKGISIHSYCFMVHAFKKLPRECFIFGEKAFVKDLEYFKKKFIHEINTIKFLGKFGGTLFEERRQFFVGNDPIFSFVKAGAFYESRSRLLSDRGGSLTSKKLGEADNKILAMDRHELTEYLTDLALDAKRYQNYERPTRKMDLF